MYRLEFNVGVLLNTRPLPSWLLPVSIAAHGLNSGVISLVLTRYLLLVLVLFAAHT